MKKILFCSFLFACVSSIHAQSNIDKTIKLKDSTIERTVSFEIKKGVEEMDFSVKGFLSSGSLSFTIHDPEGKREGGFGLSTEEDKTPGSGRMTDTIRSPLPGLWKLKILITHATGDLSYKINFK